MIKITLILFILLSPQIRDAPTVEDARSEMLHSSTLPSLLGSVRHIASLSDRDKLIEDAVEFYMYGRLQSAFDQ